MLRGMLEQALRHPRVTSAVKGVDLISLVDPGDAMREFDLDSEERMTEQADARGYRTFRIHGATAPPCDTGRARG